MPPTLTDLPNELLIQIANDLTGLSPIALSKVSKRLHAIASPVVYESLFLRSVLYTVAIPGIPKKALPLAFKKYGQHVKRASMMGRDFEYDPAKPSLVFPFRDQVCCDSGYVVSQLAHFDRLEALNLIHVPIASWKHFSDLLLHLVTTKPRLKTLMLTIALLPCASTGLQDPDPNGPPPIDFPHDLSTIAKLQSCNFRIDDLLRCGFVGQRQDFNDQVPMFFQALRSIQPIFSLLTALTWGQPSWLRSQGGPVNVGTQQLHLPALKHIRITAVDKHFATWKLPLDKETSDNITQISLQIIHYPVRSIMEKIITTLEPYPNIKNIKFKLNGHFDMKTLKYAKERWTGPLLRSGFLTKLSSLEEIYWSVNQAYGLTDPVTLETRTQSISRRIRFSVVEKPTEYLNTTYPRNIEDVPSFDEQIREKILGEGSESLEIAVPPSKCEDLGNSFWKTLGHGPDCVCHTRD